MKKSKKGSKDGYSQLIEDFCENEFNVLYDQYPEIKRQRGDCQAIVIASSRYKINLKNTIHVPFYTRQFKYIKTWAYMNDIDLKKREIVAIQNQINGCNVIKEKRCLVLSFIQQERELLGNPVDMDMDWFSKRIPVVLKYYYHIL
jgi:hypothetical protein